MKYFNFLLMTFICTHSALGTFGPPLFEETKEQEGVAHQVKTYKFQTLNFDDIRKFEGGFKSSRLQEADCIIPSMIDLLKTEIVIKKMSANPAFAKIKALDLSGTLITPEQALKDILGSKILGSERTCKVYPRRHGRYGCPWSEIHVTIGNGDDFTVYDDSYEPSPLDFNPEKEHHQGFLMEWRYTKEGKVEEKVIGVKTLRVSRY